jgi:methylmalonyl-CoA mutase cobalamin-binding subunit
VGLASDAGRSQASSTAMQHRASPISIRPLSRVKAPPPETLSRWARRYSAPSAIEPWFEHIERFEGSRFDRELRNTWADHGGFAFIERYAAPFVIELGRRWARAEISVAQEHFASERLREFMAQKWRPLSDTNSGATCVCATLAGEQHVLGLHMAALTLSLGNMQIVFLGASLPPTDIAMVAVQRRVDAVVLSASSAADSDRLAADTAALRAALPDTTALVVGGTGFLRAQPANTTVLESFGQLRRWQRQFAAT